MAGDPAHALDPQFPNLDPEVVRGYREAPETMIAEIINGSLSLLPKPRRRHSRAAVRLMGEFVPFDNPRGDDPGGWVILTEIELHLGKLPDILAPDLAGWRRERLSGTFLDDDDGLAITLAPDWVCEVLSPSTERIDRGPKLRIYHRERVGHVWLVSPSLRTLEVFRWSEAGMVLIDTAAGDAEVRAEPFDARPLSLGSLWAL